MLAAIFIAERRLGDRRPAVVRGLSYALVLILVAEAVFVTVRLVTDLIEGGPETNSASELLGVGSGVWLYTILAFTFLYWLLDGGGPEARIWHPPEFPHLAFPEQLNPVVAPPGWRPEFADYLYLGFTNATALSPTDVMPLARWGKLAMTVQAIGSLAILGLVGAALLAGAAVEWVWRHARVAVVVVAALAVFEAGWAGGTNVGVMRTSLPAVDRPIAGLLTDLKRRGLLEDTLIWWGSEFGRTPYAEKNGTGRDHNPGGFTIWLAGAGVKPGFAFGETDEFGHRAVQGKVHMHDVHATILHLLGLDHERLTFPYSGRDFRLTDTSGRVVREILA